MRRGAKPAKAHAEAKRPIARKSPKSKGSRVQELEKGLAEALKRQAEAQQQQAATAEILRVISQSQTDLQPVFDAIVRSAAELCHAFFGVMTRYDGRLATLVAHHNMTPEAVAGLRRVLTSPPTLETATGRALLRGVVDHTHDLASDAASPAGAWIAQVGGFRTNVAVPLLRDGQPIGSISVARRDRHPFSGSEIGLLKTFADQAVIAMENVRLFTALQEKNEALTQAHAQVTEALEQQAATGEILRAIAQAQTDAQPVFDTIVRSAARLCHAIHAVVFLTDGRIVHAPANYGSRPEALAAARARFPRPLAMDSTGSMAILTRAVVHVPDIEEPSTHDFVRESGQLLGFRSVVTVPMLREGEVVGAILVARREAGRFPDAEVELLRTFADQAVIAIANVRLFKELEVRNRELTEALTQQTATGEILRVIASSPTDLQPVLDAVVESAGRLCQAADTFLLLVEAEQLKVAAIHGSVDPGAITLSYSIHPGWVAGRAVVDARTVHVEDLANAGAEYPLGREIAVRFGHRTALATPLLREGISIGALFLRRREVRPFTDNEIALLQTFADQAVIAIENARLFTELQEKNRALTQAHAQVSESLERQTATSEILRVISSSPTDVQPVFEAIARNAVALCGGIGAVVLRFDGEMLHVAGHHNVSPDGVARVERAYPRRPARDYPPGRAFLDRAVVHVPDLQAATEFVGSTARQRGAGSQLAVPLLREQEAIGVIGLARDVVGPFSPEQIEVLQTFADQAVIAIENVHLFTELQEKNQALTQAHAQVTEALERQTATSEILRTIAQAQIDVQPVFDTIVRSAARLCQATNAAVFLTDGRLLYHPANYGSAPEKLAAVRARYPRPVDMGTTPGIAILTRSVVHVPDIEEPSALEHVQQIGRLLGFRSVIAVPMLREGEAIGVVNVARREPGRFSDGEVELLKTFADQAVIAIENVRLFKELEARTADLTRSVGQLTALGEVGRAVSSTLDLETVLTTIVSRAVQLSGLDGGVVFEYDAAAEEFVQRVATETGAALAEARRTMRIRKGEGVLGRAAITLEPVQVPDITEPAAYEGRLRETLIASGIRAILAVPMVREGQLIGCLAVTRNRSGAFPAETIELLRTFATQSALAIQNARLFHEIEDKSRQLEAASRHKSEFLANMSHELRTPLNAIIGFSEVLAERMFGELNEKQEEYLKDIHASGQHLLSLINDILDLSKVEAGRMELELTDFNLPTTLDNALTLVRERAGRHGIALHMSVDERVEHVRADERKIRQVVLNLLSNAIKFTPEGGRIDVRAIPVDGSVEVSVTDTGLGIASEDQEAIFEEFRQVGTAAKKVEGTGLGLALSRKFIELHGGRIRVQSQLGVGATFTFTVPVRRGE
jgi:GAF domain-containing protein